MNRVYLLAMTPDDVIHSVRSFPAALERSADLRDRLPNARAWYALRDNGDWIFAPSKWAGYSGMTTDRYLNASRDTLDGRKTEKRLRQWFTPVAAQSPQHAELQTALAAFLGSFGKEPNGVARISVIATADAADNEDDLVDLFVRVIRRLDSAQQTRILTALRA
jgi:hypothetical protein